MTASRERQARQKVRMAVRMLTDAQEILVETGHVFGTAPLTAEALAPMAEELTARLEEADRLTPLAA